MKILHAYCLNYNIGDLYLGIGVKNLLRNYLDVELIAETNLQGTIFNEYYINNVVNKNYDLLVIGGGGIIHGKHWPNGWFWLIDEAMIEKIKIPFIVYGAGVNYFPDEGQIPEVGKSHLLETIRRSAFFSVRNDESIFRLKSELGVDVPVVPDPGFHVNLNRQYSCKEREPFVMVQLANDKPNFRFNGFENYQGFTAEMRIAVKEISKKYKVILSPHVFDDVKLCENIADNLTNVEIWEFSKYAFDRAIESIGYYEKAQFVIAMRGHGQIVPMAFNTPVISLENHPKHGGLMRTLGIGKYNISLAGSKLAERLTDTINILELDEKNYVSHLEQKNIEMRQQTHRAFVEIIKRIT